eukprot:PhF_6_TR29374/c0_g1_i1/m.43258
MKAWKILKNWKRMKKRKRKRRKTKKKKKTTAVLKPKTKKKAKSSPTLHQKLLPVTTTTLTIPSMNCITKGTFAHHRKTSQNYTTKVTSKHLEKNVRLDDVPSLTVKH